METPATIPTFDEDGHRAVQTSIGDLHDYVSTRERVRGERRWRLLLLATLNVADVITTFMVLGAGGHEANPVLAPVVATWWMPTLMKAAVFGLVWGTVWRCPIRSIHADRLLRIAVIFFAIVVGWNLVMLTHALPALS